MSAAELMEQARRAGVTIACLQGRHGVCLSFNGGDRACRCTCHDRA